MRFDLGSRNTDHMGDIVLAGISGAELAKVRSANPSPRNDLLSYCAQCIRTARFNLLSLSDVANAAKFLPKNLQAEAFDVLQYHLQKPVQRRRCQSEKSLRWITASLMGIISLGCSYFERDAAHRRRFVGCWPSILKWLEAIIDGHHFHREEATYFQLASDVFGVARFIRGEVFDEPDVLEFVVRMWIGVRTPDGGDHFSAQPLQSCLSRHVQTNNTSHVCEVLNTYFDDPEQLVDKLIARLRHAMYTTSPPDIENITVLLKILVSLASLQDEALGAAVCSPKTGRALLSMTIDFMNNTSPSHEQFIIASRASFHIIYCCILPGNESARDMMESRILFPLLKLASFNIGGALNFDAPSFLRDLLKGLIYEKSIMTCLEELRNHTSSVAELLLKTSKQFRKSWLVFEAVLLEQVVLLNLFKVGYAPEHGDCASVSIFLREVLLLQMLYTIQLTTLLILPSSLRVEKQRFARSLESARGARSCFIAPPLARSPTGAIIGISARWSTRNPVRIYLSTSGRMLICFCPSGCHCGQTQSISAQSRRDSDQSSLALHLRHCSKETHRAGGCCDFYRLRAISVIPCFCAQLPRTFARRRERQTISARSDDRRRDLAAAREGSPRLRHGRPPDGQVAARSAVRCTRERCVDETNCSEREYSRRRRLS